MFDISLYLLIQIKQTILTITTMAKVQINQTNLDSFDSVYASDYKHSNKPKIKKFKKNLVNN